MTSHEATPIDEYRLPADPVEAALAYPGQRPEGSFYTDGNEVILMPDDFDGFKSAVNERLTALYMPLIEERIPVLAYGANANPEKLAAKMAKFDTGDSQQMQVVPHCAVRLDNVAAVWHGRPGQNGSYFAELYSGTEAKGTILQAHVAFLTIEQLGALDATEGATYTKIELSAKVGLGEDDKNIDVIAYAALDSQLLLNEDGQPVLVDGLRHDGSTLSAATATEVVAYTLHNVSEAVTGAHSEYEFIANGLGMKLSEKKQRQTAIHEVMKLQVMSRRYSVKDENPDSIIGRVDFASLPGADKHVHLIPEMVWPGDMARANSRRALSELSIRTGLAIAQKES